MAVSEQLKALVAQMPDPDGRGMYTENIDKEKIEKAIEAIYKGGPAHVQGLIDMLAEPGTVEDVKPHYALHCVANHAVVAGDEQACKALCETLCKALDGNYSDYHKSFLCQTLQWVGHGESSAALGKLLTNEALCDPAAMALVAIKDGSADTLRKALPGAQGKCRLAIVDALAALGDAGSAGTLKEALGDEDREVRIAAGAGLAKLGDAGSAALLIKAADAQPGWERIQAAKNCFVLAEKLAAAGKQDDAKKIYTYLRDSRQDVTEKYVRAAAEKALQG